MKSELRFNRKNASCKKALKFTTNNWNVENTVNVGQSGVSIPLKFRITHLCFRFAFSQDKNYFRFIRTPSMKLREFHPDDLLSP